MQRKLSKERIQDNIILIQDGQKIPVNNQFRYLCSIISKNGGPIVISIIKSRLAGKNSGVQWEFYAIVIFCQNRKEGFVGQLLSSFWYRILDNKETSCIEYECSKGVHVLLDVW